MSLYLVGTPIGNLEDMTFRAVRILRQASLIAAEDTRVTRKLLTHFDIATPMVSYHDYSGQRQAKRLVARMAGEDVALVSDAGMPGLSDPGYRLVKMAVDAGIQVVPIPGATAAVTALVSSGLPSDAFLFRGFLPRQPTARQKALGELAAIPYTLVFYESPHRLVKLLQDIETVLGDRLLCVGRELTKKYEEIWRGAVSEGVDYFAGSPVRGEITVLVAGASKESVVWEEEAVVKALQAALAAGNSRKEAAAQIAKQSGWRKRAIYNLPI